MNTAAKTPVVILHEPDADSPKLPVGYRFDYTTTVDGDTVTLTVSVVKNSKIARFFTGRDLHIKNLTRKLSRELSVERSAKSMQTKLAFMLFPSR